MKKELFIPASILFIITSVFFYKTILFGKVPFPADVLVSDFQPWRSTPYLGYAPGGIPNKAQYPDVIRQMYPWKTLAISQLQKGVLPLWNPYNFSGAPLLANFQSAALYPLNILYLFLSQINAWAILVILQPLLAACFMYLYMKKIRTNPYGALLASLSYGFCGFMSVWLEYNTVGHVVLWLPLILLSIEHFTDKQPRRVWFFLIVFSNAASLLAGHPQVYAYMATFSLIYAYSRLKHHAFFRVIIATILGIGISGIQLIPGLELIRLAARSPHDMSTLFTKILIQPWQLLSLPFPNIFGNPATRTYWPADTFVGKVTTIGFIPLFFFLSTIRRKDTFTKFYLWATATILILITANPVTALVYRIPLPVLSSSSPTLMAFLLSFSLATLCGLGLDSWMNERHTLKKLIRRTIETAILFVILFLAAKLPLFPNFHNHATTAIKALLYASFIAGATLSIFLLAITKPKLMRVAVILLLIMHAGDLFLFFTKFNPFVSAQLIFPPHPVLTFFKNHTPDRYWGYGTADIPANLATQYQIFSPEGYDPLYPASYGQFLYSYRNGKTLSEFDDTTRSDAAISSSFGDGGLTNKNKQYVLNALSVRYILDRTENAGTTAMFPPEIYRRIFSFDDWIVYENTQARPRAYMDNGSAFVLSYQPERVVIRTESSGSAVLTLTDSYYPGWTAAVDSKPVGIRRSRESLREVPVSAGTHTVTMVYDPGSVKIGIFISIASIIATCVSLIFLY